jgi:hypothetical protein
MSGTQAVLTSLAIIFSIGDLIGKKRLSGLEDAWLRHSFAFFRATAAFTQLSRQLAFHSFVALLVSACFPITIASMFLLERHVGNSPAVLIVVIVSLTMLLCSWGLHKALPSLGMLRASTVASYHERRLLLTIRKLFDLSAQTLDRGEQMTRRTKEPRAGAGAIWIVTAISLVAVTLSIAIVISAMARMLLCCVFVFFWLCLFAPSEVLSWLGKRTGAENYFTVGKYHRSRFVHCFLGA